MKQEQSFTQPRDKQGRFVNEFNPFTPLFSEVWKWQRTDSEWRKEKKQEFKTNPDLQTQVALIPSIAMLPADAIIWLGHASFLFRLGGTNLLVDPVLGKIAPFSKRYSAFPIPAQELKGIDALLISHDHRDHMDASSVSRIVEQNPGLNLLTGLAMGDLFKKYRRSIAYQEKGWYQQYQTDDLPCTITYLPTRHWGRRGLWDTNSRLWGAFWLEYAGKKIFFGGDTGYDEAQFRKIRTLYGKPDVYIVGIGAFAPEWFMGSNHMGPADALKSFEILAPEAIIPMHYGTFDLSDESPFLPPLLLKQLVKDTVWENRVHYLLPGQSFSW